MIARKFKDAEIPYPLERLKNSKSKGLKDSNTKLSAENGVKLAIFKATNK